MPPQFKTSLALLLLSLTVFSHAISAEDAAALEAKAFEQLQQGQVTPAANIDAARSFAKAAMAYERAGKGSQAGDINAYLYWCKRKLTQPELDKLAKDDPEAFRRLQAADAKVASSGAEGWLQRTADVAIATPEKHLQLALRFYEVADRFTDTETSIEAEHRSVAEMQLAGASALAYPRFPIPSAERLKRSETFIRGNYAEDYAKTTSEGYASLLAKLTAQLDESKDDPVARYAVLHEALLLAAKVPDLPKLFALADDICAQFRADPLAVKKASLATIAVSKDPDAVKAIAAARTVMDKPDDTTANGILGRYLAVQGEWPQALPYLAKSSDAALKKASAQELAGAADTAAKTALADAWWECGQKDSQKEFKGACVEHAGALYKGVLPDLTGSVKDRVEARISAGEDAHKASDAVAVEQKKAERREANVAAAENIPAAERLNIDKGVIAGLEIRANKHLPVGTYKASGTLSWPIKFGAPFTLIVDPGTTVSGATFALNYEGSLDVKGTADSPCTFSGCSFLAEYGTHANFEFCIFDKCRFEKIGGAVSPTAQGATEWTCRNCILNNHIFPHLGHRQYDYRFDECVFNNVVFPITSNEHGGRREKAVPIDVSALIHSQFSHIESCTLIDCTIPPFFAWSIAKSNFYTCRFVGTDIYDSASELTVDSNYYSPIPPRFPDTRQARRRQIRPGQNARRDTGAT